jgi:hypothetical protein
VVNKAIKQPQNRKAPNLNLIRGFFLFYRYK